MRLCCGLRYNGEREVRTRRRESGCRVRGGAGKEKEEKGERSEGEGERTGNCTKCS